MTPIRFIAGSGRSGTTWIQDAIAAANGLRPVFEPLHPYVSKVGHRYAHRALPADEVHADLAAFLVEASRGGGPKLWTRYRQQWRWLIPPASNFSTRNDAGRFRRHWVKFLKELPRMTWDGMRRDPLVKCIRANLMLPWIARQLDCRVVLVVRHPGAVVESELRSGWNATFALERFRNDAKLREMTRGRYDRLLAQRLEPLESLALRWLIENQWISDKAESLEIPVIHYERLRSSDGDEWTRLCRSLDVAKVPDAGLLMRPSQQSDARRTEVAVEQPKTPRWSTNLTAEQKARLDAIFNAVGFSTYTMASALPLPPSAAAVTQS